MIGSIEECFDRLDVLQQVGVVVGEGQVVSMIGPNGAGKTTLLSALMGVLPCRGTIRFDGCDIAGHTTVERVGMGISLVPERRELFASMTVEDNLRLGAYSRFRRGARDLGEALRETYARFPRLHERRSQLAGTLSGGDGRCSPSVAR